MEEENRRNEVKKKKKKCMWIWVINDIFFFLVAERRKFVKAKFKIIIIHISGQYSIYKNSHTDREEKWHR